MEKDSTQKDEIKVYSETVATTDVLPFKTH